MPPGAHAMLGLMQQRPLLISSLLDYADAAAPVPRSCRARSKGPIRRTTWGRIASRARQVANALRRLGVAQSDRIATLAWNHDRHVEIYFGATCSGAVLHTVNPRLFPDQSSHPRGSRVQLTYSSTSHSPPGRTAAATPERARLHRSLRARCVAVDQHIESDQPMRTC